MRDSPLSFHNSGEVLLKSRPLGEYDFNAGIFDRPADQDVLERPIPK
jgi:hypothetical protein